MPLPRPDITPPETKTYFVACAPRVGESNPCKLMGTYCNQVSEYPEGAKPEEIWYTYAMIKISTKTGDAGLSSLANGQRLVKTHQIFQLLGELDELNSWLGLLVERLGTLPTQQRRVQKEIKLLLQLQNWLYQASALIAAAPKFKLSLRVLKKIEVAEDALQKELHPDWYQHFLYPGGSELGAWLDISRAVARRVERSFLIWQQTWEQPVTLEQRRALPEIQKTLNRISDYLYLLRCWCNAQSQVTERQFRTKKK